MLSWNKTKIHTFIDAFPESEKVANEKKTRMFFLQSKIGTESETVVLEKLQEMKDSGKLKRISYDNQSVGNVGAIMIDMGFTLY